MTVRVLVGALVITGALAVSALFAMFGEPQSVWLWRDVLGVMQ